jgi:hypothetical protein
LIGERAQPFEVSKVAVKDGHARQSLPEKGGQFVGQSGTLETQQEFLEHLSFPVCSGLPGHGHLL